ncbi:hypothetical protein M407DRAFT_28669 [Tulasnella calospora MUT 4182]|uniref:Protein kinase domain-containing protein n=1 Tax=Tulasnella calospora MUT 4182 TaxID=1051891 RepID=A0A0C3KJV3_9AGAM|nr:hypothetical protein M407DRAFT_28669 [Tulasnella calospora MUT 4182]
MHRAVITDFSEARSQTESRGFETTGGSPRRQAASTKSKETLYDGCPEITVSTANAELTLTGPGWSFRWAAPEVLNEEDQCLESDIWALGWIAWEIVTDNCPFPEARTNALITIKVIAGLLPLLSDDVQLSQIGQLCDVMVRCWKSEPKERLSAAECRRAIELLPYLILRFRSNGTIQSAALLVRMGEMHRMQGGHKALKLFDEACSIARSAGLKSPMAEALYIAADSHRQLSNYGQAEELCNQALAICTSIGDDLVRAGAEESYNEALAMYTRLGNSLGRANVFQELETIHDARSNYAKAEESYHQALVIYTNIGHSLAEESFNQALAISTSVGDRLGRANALLKLGEMHQARSNHGRAEEFFRQALDILTSIGKSLEQTRALLGLREVLLRQAQYSGAKSFLQDAAEITNRIKNNWGQNRSRALVAEILEAAKSSTEPPP